MNKYRYVQYADDGCEDDARCRLADLRYELEELE